MYYSFSLFLGYNIHVTGNECKKPNAEFREALRTRIREEILAKIDSINNQIKKRSILGVQKIIS